MANFFIPAGVITATVSHSTGGNGFSPRKTETREIRLPSHYAKRHGRYPNTAHEYEVGDQVRAGAAKGWWIDSIS